MPTAEQLMLQDLQAKYATEQVGPAFKRLYGETANDRMFANFHERLNGHFEFMNYKAGTNGHFNAEDSRQLLALIEEIQTAQEVLRLVGTEFVVVDGYRAVIERCREFLVLSGGSPIPEDMPRIDIVKYKPVFSLSDTVIRAPERPTSYPMRMVGSGAFANVYSFVDPVYDVTIALKRAKSDLEPKELERFRREFEVLKSLRYPYILEVYKYSEDRPEYTMEFCDFTLHKFMQRHNGTIGESARKRMALQFLYGMNHIHSRGLLHRDLSYTNALIKQYDAALMVKLSDFGLYKDPESTLTRTESELRGTLLDPAIDSFKDYNLANEIYGVGAVLSFIFSGRQNLDACSGDVRAIVNRCVDIDVAARYPDVRPIIGDVVQLPPGLVV
jgi:tRNA A-37 threonylcarbamoyl transferase component Bud32